MILDNEEQRVILMQVITTIPLQGALQAMAQNVQALGQLLEAVKSATVTVGEAPAIRDDNSPFERIST